MNRLYLAFNFEDEHFSKPEVRKAVAMGVDRQMIYDRVANGVGGVAETFISPMAEDFADDRYTMPEHNVDVYKRQDPAFVIPEYLRARRKGDLFSLYTLRCV